ncbi:MAG: amidohydrolase family protein [Clostridiales bacterium]|nr:amidohydrolase family protein [Clostridiales bacterium]
MKKALKCGKLFDAQAESVLENRLVLVDGKDIVDVLPCPEQLPEGYEVIDLSDRFVMPGLIDAHVHLGSGGTNADLTNNLYALIGDLAFFAAKNAKANLEAGFTTVRDCGGNGFINISARKAVASGQFPGSRIYACAGSITSTGGHGDTHYNPYLHSTLSSQPCDSPDECRKMSRYYIKHGADFIKVLATGGVMSRGTTLGAQQLTFEELSAVVEIANMYGVHTAAHAHGTEGIKAAARAGITTIEHGMILDDEAIDIFCEKGTYQVPTIIAAERIITCGPEMGLADWMMDKAKQALDRHHWGLQEGLKRGVKYCFGTDAGTPSNFHGKQGYEFELMVQCGFTPMQALVAATKTNAGMLKNDKLGAVAAGKFADIVAFEANPLEDITTMKNCVFVMKEGEVYKS